MVTIVLDIPSLVIGIFVGAILTLIIGIWVYASM